MLKTSRRQRYQAAGWGAIPRSRVVPCHRWEYARKRRSWIVAELAEQVEMSLTGFAVRFSRLAGIAPLDYVTKWRMETAGDLLHTR
jgi:AraC-like DNA-binding protein